MKLPEPTNHTEDGKRLWTDEQVVEMVEGLMDNLVSHGPDCYLLCKTHHHLISQLRGGRDEQ